MAGDGDGIAGACRVTVLKAAGTYVLDAEAVAALVVPAEPAVFEAEMIPETPYTVTDASTD